MRSRSAPRAPTAPCAILTMRGFVLLFVLFVLIVETAATASAKSSSSSSKKSSQTPRGGRQLPSSEQLAEIRRVVEMVRESRDQLPPEKLAQLVQQLRQLRARIGATSSSDGDGEQLKEKGETVSTEGASRLHQVRSLSGGFNNDLGAHTLDAVEDIKGTLFYDDVPKGVIEAPPPKEDKRNRNRNKDANSFHDGKDFKNTDFGDSHRGNKGDISSHGNGGFSIAVGVSGGLHAFDGKTQTNTVRHEGAKRVIGVGTSYPVPHDVRSYGTPKPGGSSGSSHKVHPTISDSSTVSSHLGDDGNSFGDARHATETHGVSGGIRFGPPKGAISSSDVYADSTTIRSLLEHSHQAQGQLFHENYVRSGFQSAVIPPGAPHAPTVHIAPAVGPHAGTVVMPGSSPHVVSHVAPHVSPHMETIVGPPGPAAVSVHIGIGGHRPVVGYTPPAHVSPEDHLIHEKPRSSGKIIFPISGPHHAEASYVAPPPEVHVTHVEEHVTSDSGAPLHVTFGGNHPEPHVTHVEEHVYEKHHNPRPSHVKEHHETYSYSSKDDYHSSSQIKPHDASQYGPPQVKQIPVPYVPQHVTHVRPVHVTHYKKRPGFFDSLLSPFWRLKSFLFGGGRGHARPISHGSFDTTPSHNYYEYGAAVTYPKKCRCIDSKSVLGVLVAGVAAAGLFAYVYTYTTNGTSVFGRTVDGPDRAAMARLMLEEACSLGADAERMWNGTVWIGDDDEGAEDGADEWVGKKTDEQALNWRINELEERNQLLDSLSDAKRGKQKLLEQELQALGSRTARQLGDDSTASGSSHQVVKKATASIKTSPSSEAQGRSHRMKRSAAVLDQASLASDDFPHVLV